MDIQLQNQLKRLVEVTALVGLSTTLGKGLADQLLQLTGQKT